MSEKEMKIVAKEKHWLNMNVYISILAYIVLPTKNIEFHLSKMQQIESLTYHI